jgi:hypothetical protein
LPVVVHSRVHDRSRISSSAGTHSAMSRRDTGKLISTPASTRRLRLAHQSQQRPRDAPLDAFRHELAVAALQIVQSAGNELHGIEGHSGLSVQ